MNQIIDGFSKRAAKLVIPVGFMVISTAAHAGMVITPTFTAAFNSDFGANAAAAQAAWVAAASIFTSNFSDNIHINITVDAVADNSIFGRSATSLNSYSYASLRAAVVNDATTADDNTAIGANGSLTVADPTAGSGTWWVTRSQAKALGLIADDSSDDGTTTFGAGNAFTFSGPIASGTYDFQGVAAHEISEVMGRLGLGGEAIGSYANSYTLIDAFSFSGAGTRVLGNGGVGGQGSFSINNGTTLLKQYNDQASNGQDYRDWAPGTNDAINQYSASGVTNPVSTVDLQQMDVLGYNRALVASIPEPSTFLLLASALAAGGLLRRRG